LIEKVAVKLLFLNLFSFVWRMVGGVFGLPLEVENSMLPMRAPDSIVQFSAIYMFVTCAVNFLYTQKTGQTHLACSAAAGFTVSAI
jgi:hypothetical protein